VDGRANNQVGAALRSYLCADPTRGKVLTKSRCRCTRCQVPVSLCLGSEGAPSGSDSGRCVSLAGGRRAETALVLPIVDGIATLLPDPGRDCLSAGLRLDFSMAGSSARGDRSTEALAGTVVSTTFPGATITVDRGKRHVRVDFVDEGATPELVLVPWGAEEQPVFAEHHQDDSGPFALFQDVPDGEFLLIIPGQQSEPDPGK